MTTTGRRCQGVAGIALEALSQPQMVAAAHADGEAGQLCQHLQVVWLHSLGCKGQCQHLQVLELAEQLQVDAAGVGVVVTWNDDLFTVLGGGRLLCGATHEGAPPGWIPACTWLLQLQAAKCWDAVTKSLPVLATNYAVNELMRCCRSFVGAGGCVLVDVLTT